MDIVFITIFPEMFEGVLDVGVLGVAARKGAARYRVVDLREFASDSYGSVDDYPYGGGPGMVMMAPPIVEAVESVTATGDSGDVHVINMSPSGPVFTQAKAAELAGRRTVAFICGRYKGVDERVNELVVDDAGSAAYPSFGFELSQRTVRALREGMYLARVVLRFYVGFLGGDDDDYKRAHLAGVFKNGRLHRVWFLYGDNKQFDFRDIPDTGDFYRVELMGEPAVDTPLQKLLYGKVLAMTNPIYAGS